MSQVPVIVDPAGKIRESGFASDAAASARCDEKNRILRARVPDVVGSYYRVEHCASVGLTIDDVVAFVTHEMNDEQRLALVEALRG